MSSFARSSLLRNVALTSRSASCAIRTSPAASSLLKSSAASTFNRPTIVRDALPGSIRIAAFHASARRAILPPLPQRIQGTANDAAVVPHPEPLHGGYHWVMERAVSVLVLPLTIAPFVGGSLNPVLDATFCGLLVLHTHFGFQSVIADYLPRYRVPKSRFVADWGLLAGSALVAWGLWEFETNDVGLTEGVRRIWKAGRE